jgi:hypothetical protein
MRQHLCIAVIRVYDAAGNVSAMILGRLAQVPQNAVSFSSGCTTKRLQPFAAIMVSIVRSTVGYKPPFPIP